MKYYTVTILILFLFTGCVHQEQNLHVNKNFNQLFDGNKWIPANSSKKLDMEEIKHEQK